jgi:hypothetical protein
MKTIEFYVQTTKWDLLKRSAVRVGFCAAPYFLLAWLWSVYRDDRFFHGWWFWWCVVLIPGLGLALDVWRLKQSPDGCKRLVEPGAAPNNGPATQPDNSDATEGPPSVS